MFTPRTAGLSEHVAFVCLGYGLPGRRLLIRGRYCWMVCQRGWRSGKIVREAGWLCTFSSPFASLPRTPCFSPLGTRARRCPKLKILTSSFSLFASAFSYLHSLGLFQALRALYFLFKGECSKQTGIRREALIWNFRLRLSSLVSCCFGDDI